MILDEFESQVISACDASQIVVSVANVGSGITWTRIRAYLLDETFVESFFNESTQKTAFAWITGGTRIFGADNTGGWHWHPVDAPEEHIPVEKDISFVEFLQRVEELLQQT